MNTHFTPHSLRPEPPHNIEAEQALLGAILVTNEALDRVSVFLDASHFYDPVHGQIYSAMRAMIEEGRAATPVTLAPVFESAPDITPDLSVPQYLGRLATHATTIINAESYGRTIHDPAVRRTIIAIADDAALRARSAQIDATPADLLADLESEAASLASTLATSNTVNVVCATDLTGEPPRREFLVPDLVPHKQVTMLSGDGGTGKSLLALQLAAAVAAGGRWISKDVAGGPVLYVGAEDDLAEMHRRLASICAQTQIPIDQLSNLNIVCLAGEDAVLASFGPDNLMRTTPLWRSILRRIERSRPVLVVWDTCADLFGGEENNRTHVRQFVQLLRHAALKFGHAGLLLSHPSLSGMASGAGTSGSTAWSNSVRSRLYLERIKEGTAELDPDRRRLTTKKSNYGRVGDEIDLVWRAGAFHAVADLEPAELADGAAARAEAAFLDLLKLFNDQKRRVSPHRGANYAPAAFASEETGRVVGKPALEAAMSRLLTSGRIRIDEVGPPSKRRSVVEVA